MIDYKELFSKFRNQIASEEDTKTPCITKKIKEFFAREFHDYFVAPSSAATEFLVDVFVATKNPRTLGDGSDGGKLRVILAVESELGGEGGGAQGYLKRNVLEDFAKLLVIRADYKILLFTSLPYAGEQDHVASRVREMESVYKNADCPGNILLIHLQSTAQKTRAGYPTNPKVSLRRDTMAAYVLSRGLSVQQLA